MASPAAATAAAPPVLERGPHPYGVKPLGNMMVDALMQQQQHRPRKRQRTAATFGNTREVSLGGLRRLSDESLLELLGWLPPHDLARCAAVSRALYVFALAPELWKEAVLAGVGNNFEFHNTWRDTFVWHALGGSKQSTTSAAATATAAAFRPHTPLRIPRFYSDALYQPWLCASMAIDKAWLATDNVTRVDAATLSVEQFVHVFEEPNRPVLISGLVSKWKACGKWTEHHLEAAHGKDTFTAGPVDLTMSQYLSYQRQVIEERPLYLFDKQFARRAKGMANDYTPPHYFADDLFRYLGPRKGEDEGGSDPGAAESAATATAAAAAAAAGLKGGRPSHRWLIIGAKRSGSTFHIDPNATSAWNACVAGAKKWLMYPPDSPPPGVHASSDGAEVATTVSVMEWFRQFYEHRSKGGTVQPVEFVSRAGDLVFVPSGWWHTVLNLEDHTVAITENYCSPRTLDRVRAFFAHQPHNVSGLPHEERPYLPAAFDAALAAARPALLAASKQRAEEEKARKEKARAAAESRRALWHGGQAAATAGAGAGAGAGASPRDNVATSRDSGSSGGGGFSFNFAL